MAQNREFYKYFQLPQRRGFLHQPPVTPATEAAEKELLPQSSHDTTLTALAQLGALRLSAQRCMISLFDHHNQFILAESTRTLSLQNGRVHSEGDALWLGSSVIRKLDGICHYVCDNAQLNAGQEEQSGAYFALIIPDLMKDDRTKHRQYVQNAPHLRFYAGVPIISRRGIAIGAFSVCDGAPRSGLDLLELRFMRETAAAIMNHLEMVRSKEQNRLGANMIAGLGSFVEGRVFPSDSAHSTTTNRSSGANPACPPTGQRSGPDGHRPAQGKTGNASVHRVEAPEARVSESASLAKDSNDQQTTLSSGTKEIFQRAAKVLQESMEVEGVIFYDASVNSYGTLLRTSDDRSSDIEGSVSGDGNSGSDRENAATGVSSSEADDSALCDVLGSSTVGDLDQPVGGMCETFLRSLLRHYPRGGIFNIDESGGISSSEGSDSAPNSSVTREVLFRHMERDQPPQLRSKKKRQKWSAQEESRVLVKTFPSARSLALFPLWDSRRNRLFSAMIVWTNSPRVFSLRGELAYLYAFSNSIMAEIHRLDIELVNKANRTLVSSISHELRSPLHGILGSTELLGDSSITPSQRVLLETIEHCGRSLLDIINNMLDFAKINQFTRKSRSTRTKDRVRRRRQQRALPGQYMPKDSPGYGVASLTSDVPLDTVLEEVIDTVFAGHCFSNKSGLQAPDVVPIPLGHRNGAIINDNSPSDVISHFNESLTVMYEVESGAGWLFETQAGIWRRIVMNLFGNALKYTPSGYILVTLKAVPLPTTSKSKPLPSDDSPVEEMVRVVLTVKDSGQGIDREYMKSNVFKPFSQEDAISPGSGLGLSIVHQNVLSLQGKVDINSIKGIGTELTVTVDLPRLLKAGTGRSGNDLPPLQNAKESVRGKSIGFIGFDAPSTAEEEVHSVVRSSLTRMCQEHFGMQVGLVMTGAADHDIYDFYLVLHSRLDEVTQVWSQTLAAERNKGRDFRGSPSAVVICSTPQMAQRLSTSASQGAPSGIFEFISQPCGPSKMGNALLACIKRQQAQLSQPLATLVDPKTNSVTHSDNSILAASYATQDSANPVTMSLASISLNQPEATVTAQVPSVLLVDDNDVNLKLLVAFMKKAKFSYLTASNGLQALEVYKWHFPAVQIVLMDISMPVMDGLESTREIRLFEKMRQESSNAATKPATIIALSGLGSAQIRQEAFNSGMDLFLTKPVRFQELVNEINGLI
ncbi:hypothetical protein ETB97_012056 [Aspergillus alliaceus]|uniref:Sensor histidine kinase/response regulator n=1 Tax=Petromyces alliaceus TaxID=209559 RepID=A0A8H6A8J7_PETAA|nr:hypothetical protein ETB97_012056 [Aspergillus burnettii]